MKPRLLNSVQGLVNSAAADAKLDAKVGDVNPIMNSAERPLNIVLIFQGLKDAEISGCNIKLATGIVSG